MRKKKNKMVSNDTSNEVERIETELEVKSYLQNLKHAIDNGAHIIFQKRRKVDENREKEFTNAYTVASLFPDEVEEVALARELKTLSAENYRRTTKDTRHPNKSEMREFGKVYEFNGSKDVYIKIRVELLADDGKHTTYVMSFHFAEKAFTDEEFPYRRKEESNESESR